MKTAVIKFLHIWENCPFLQWVSWIAIKVELAWIEKGEKGWGRKREGTSAILITAKTKGQNVLELFNCLTSSAANETNAQSSF